MRSERIDDLGEREPDRLQLTAVDTFEQRIDDYGRLFADALVRRERRDGMVSLVFRAGFRTRARVEDLVRREAACCPFVDYRIETVDDEIVWTITNPVTGEARASVETMLDVFHALVDHPGASLAFVSSRGRVR
jgi:hypothetical protein